jgi:hypothetical protein
MEDRIDQIETENRILLEKMSNIMRVRRNNWLDPFPIFKTHSSHLLFVSLHINSAQVLRVTRVKAQNMATPSVKRDANGSFSEFQIKTLRF